MSEPTRASEPVAKPDGEYVLVEGCVYGKCSALIRSHTVHRWRRLSIPPISLDERWTRRHSRRWPPHFDTDQLPVHEVIDHVRAEEVIQHGLARLRARQVVNADGDTSAPETPQSTE